MDSADRKKLAKKLALVADPIIETIKEFERVDFELSETNSKIDQIQEDSTKIVGAINQLDQTKADKEDVARQIENMARMPGRPGNPGKTPVKGKDYFTPQEIEQIKTDISSNIKVPVVEKVVKEIVKEQPIVKTEIVKEIKEDLDGTTIIERINDEKDTLIKREKIEGLDKKLTETSNDILSRATSILDQRTQYLLNKRTSSRFTDLTDTFSSYSGLAGKGLRVNATEDGIDTYTPTDTDEKVKYDASDPTAGYVADKFVAGSGISVAEGTGANENKLVITNTDKGSDVDLSGKENVGVAQGIMDAHELTYDHDLIATALQSESDTLGTVTGRGASTSTESTFSGGLISTQLKAHSSAGISLKADNGDVIGLFGAGGGKNATFYDGVKLDASTASRILSTDASKNITALDTAAYPDLTELSYVKGVTSAIQTQLDSKLSSATAATTYLKLDTSNGPLTGDITIDKQEATLTLSSDTDYVNKLSFKNNNIEVASFISDQANTTLGFDTTLEDFYINSGARFFLQSSGNNIFYIDNTYARVYKQLGILGVPQAGVSLDVYGRVMWLGSDSNNNRGVNTNKSAYIAVPTYTGGTNKSMFAYIDNYSGNNNIWIGGGASGYNVATQISFIVGNSATSSTGRIPLTLTYSASVFNDAGADQDFRIEGDTDANLFFVDASADKIGFGVNNPSELLTLKDAGNIAFQTTTGTKIGTGTTQKIGFWNATPVIQQVTNAYTSDGEGTAYTGIDNTQAGSPYAQVSDLNQLRVAYETLRASYDDLLTKLKNTGIVA